MLKRFFLSMCIIIGHLSLAQTVDLLRPGQRVSRANDLSPQFPSRVMEKAGVVAMFHYWLNGYPLPLIGNCLGFFIAETIFITNFHCLADVIAHAKALTFRVSKIGKKTLDMKGIVALSPEREHDLAIIEVAEGYQGPQVVLNTSPLKPGSLIYTMGYPSGGLHTLRGEYYPHPQFQIMNNIVPNIRSKKGASGSPMFNGNGEIVGILYGAWGEEQEQERRFFDPIQAGGYCFYPLRALGTAHPRPGPTALRHRYHW